MTGASGWSVDDNQLGRHRENVYSTGRLNSERDQHVSNRFRFTVRRRLIHIQIPWIKQPAEFYIAHRGDQSFFQERVFLFHFRKEGSECFPHRSGFLGASAGNNRRTEALGESRSL